MLEGGLSVRRVIALIVATAVIAVVTHSHTDANAHACSDTHCRGCRLDHFRASWRRVLQ